MQLYNNVLPDMREKIEGFSEGVQSALKDCGLDIIAALVCREVKEFEDVVALLDDTFAVIKI